MRGLGRPESAHRGHRVNRRRPEDVTRCGQPNDDNRLSSIVRIFDLLAPWQSLKVQAGELALDDVVRSHYISTMKTAFIPQVRVEPELRADLDSVLLPGETLTDFVEASVRNAVEFRRVQTDFAARCNASLAEFERTGISIPADVVLSKLEAKVAARVKQLRK
jgi:hypothetical protein